mmetsp:Transcript_57628/g.122563  ORF Transcript_57628/g.122563 Transcript_57628/m.122563 type:complete len:624 (+) Transcript_57628:205-2076(+)
MSSISVPALPAAPKGILGRISDCFLRAPCCSCCVSLQSQNRHSPDRRRGGRDPHRESLIKHANDAAKAAIGTARGAAAAAAAAAAMAGGSGPLPDRRSDWEDPLPVEEYIRAKADRKTQGYQHPSLHRLDPVRVAKNERRLRAAFKDPCSTCLDLSSLDLFEMPQMTFYWEKLTRLSLNSNCLLELPDSIGSLKQLVCLDLGRNRLKTLPEAIGNLTLMSELIVMTNHLRKLEQSVPLKALAKMKNLKHLDLRFNPKLAKGNPDQVLATVVPPSCEVLTYCTQTAAQPSAAERDATLLRSQLEPWSTPALRRRLEVEFGIGTDPNSDDREKVMQLLLQQYKLRGPRAHRRLPGLDPPEGSDAIFDELLSELRGTVFPEGAKRERQTVRAQGYIILRRPLEVFDGDVEAADFSPSSTARQKAASGSDSQSAATATATATDVAEATFGNDGDSRARHGMRPDRARPKVRAGKKLGWRQRTAAAKYHQHARIWELSEKLLEGLDPEYARVFDAIAMTKNFVGSPHVDTENLGPFYGLSLGDFEGGGICVEASPFEVVEVDTHRRFGRVDGRFPHWVAPYEGERYSIIYYQTAGHVAPKSTAYFTHTGPLSHEVNGDSAAAVPSTSS